MIVTLTPNPSLDRTLEIDVLDHGAVLRARSSRVEAGGKGVNVARALAVNGVGARAVLPLGGPEGDHLATLIDELGLETRRVAIAAPVRTNVSLVEPDGTVTKINASGPELTADEVESLTKTTVAAIDGATWVAACGSLPPGAPDDLYTRLVAAVHDAGGQIAVDTSGAPLAAVIDAGPDVIKPNDEELAAIAGRELATFGDIVAAARDLRQRGVGAVLVSLGRHGAMLVDDDASHAFAPPVTPRSNVGAGDATLAGFLAAGGAGPDALRHAVAYGTAAVQLPGTSMPTADDLHPEDIEIAPVDPDRRLD